MPNLPGAEDVGLAEVWHVGVQVPVEVAALQALTQRHAAAYVTVCARILRLPKL